MCCSAAGQFVGGSFGSGASGVSATGGNGSPPGQGGDGIVTQGGAGGNGGAGVFGKGGNGIDAGGGVGGFFEGGVGPNLPGFGDGILAVQGDGHAAVFNDDVVVTGVLTSGTKDFKIDHPLDPANKYLVHASIESAEMLDLYTGNVITDSHGDATVQLPAWFEALNHDFRYQLTVIGQFAQAIVMREISNHSFAIRTDRPSIKVSWQVTGVRQDAFAKAHPLVVEEAKDARLRGFYLHPGLYGAPEEKQVEWARHPAMMQRMRELHLQRVRAAKTQQ